MAVAIVVGLEVIDVNHDAHKRKIVFIGELDSPGACAAKKDLLLKLVSASTFADRLSAETSSLSARFMRCKAKPTEDKASSSAKSSTTSANVLIDRSKDATNPVTSDNTTITATKRRSAASRWANKVSVGA